MKIFILAKRPNKALKLKNRRTSYWKKANLLSKKMSRSRVQWKILKKCSKRENEIEKLKNKIFKDLKIKIKNSFFHKNI